MAVTSTIKKELTLTNSIKVENSEGVLTEVKGQSARINSETKEISVSDWVVDWDLYKKNRKDVRQAESEFEDMAIEEQEKMIAEVNETATTEK